MLAFTLLAGHTAIAKRKAQRKRYFLRRRELMPEPRNESSWLALYHSQEDNGFILTMGLDKAAFSYILNAGFREGWDKSTITRGDVNPVGRPCPGARSLDTAGGLGVTLYYLCCTAGDTAIEQIFALVPATLSRYLTFAIPLLLKVLRELPEAQFLWPTPEEMKESSEIIHARHRKIDGAFGFMDGLNLLCQTSSDALEQNAMYNGWC
ncbi:hypothetical protein FS749_009132 [Ceratobasidium sp. UAMH 11750]|nr:hypothetical protein FS749_009132 [Ceratobasidium sp. UAMH 11750]